jgi:exodeoxyribonuclease VII small subunit
VTRPTILPIKSIKWNSDQGQIYVKWQVRHAIAAENQVTNKKDKTDIPDFEAALKKLESIVTNMEGGELTLEQALKEFETGVSLARQCQSAIQHAEQRITQLMADDDN